QALGGRPAERGVHPRGAPREVRRGRAVARRGVVAPGGRAPARRGFGGHRAKYGEDGPWLAGLSWLARGALLLGEREKAAAYADDVRRRVSTKLAGGADLEKDHLEPPLGPATGGEGRPI